MDDDEPNGDNFAEFRLGITRLPDGRCAIEFNAVGPVGKNINGCTINEVFTNMWFEFAKIAEREDHAGCIYKRKVKMVERFQS